MDEQYISVQIPLSIAIAAIENRVSMIEPLERIQEIQRQIMANQEDLEIAASELLAAVEQERQQVTAMFEAKQAEYDAALAAQKAEADARVEEAIRITKESAISDDAIAAITDAIEQVRSIVNEPVPEVPSEPVVEPVVAGEVEQLAPEEPAIDTTSPDFAVSEPVGEVDSTAGEAVVVRPEEPSVELVDGEGNPVDVDAGGNPVQ